MKVFYVLLASVALLSFTQVGYGLGMEHFGPVQGTQQPGGVRGQPEWPRGMIDIVGHKSRVYSMWVNGSEDFHFEATTKEMDELIRLYSEAHLREHVLTIKHGKGTARTFDKRKTIDCNVSYCFLGGLSRSAARRSEEALTFEPTLTIYVGASTDKEWWNTLTIPANIIVNCEIADLPVKKTVAKPKRKLLHTKVMFDETHPATDYKKGVLTKVTLWEKGDETGFDLGRISYKGLFSVAFSEKEIADFKSGKIWITLTVGDHQTAVSKKDTKLTVENMSHDKSAVKPLVVLNSKALKIRVGR